MNELFRVLALALSTTGPWAHAPSHAADTPAGSPNFQTFAVLRPPQHVLLPDPLAMTTPPAMVQARDAWLGPDKFRHFWTSYAVTAFVYAGARAADVDADAALLSSIALGAAAGFGKEFHDRRNGQRFSFRDLVADAIGLGAAYVLLRQVH